jgi:hypothetical protein
MLRLQGIHIVSRFEKQNKKQQTTQAKACAYGKSTNLILCGSRNIQKSGTGYRVWGLGFLF